MKKGMFSMQIKCHFIFGRLPGKNIERITFFSSQDKELKEKSNFICVRKPLG